MVFIFAWPSLPCGASAVKPPGRVANESHNGYRFQQAYDLPSPARPDAGDGISPLWGFAGVGVLAAGVMDMIGVQRPRGRDLATGIVRGAGLGFGALFLYWDTTHTSATGVAITILFGSMFTTSTSAIPLVAAFGLPALAIILVLYRPLLLSSVSADAAAARGVRVRLTGLLCLVAIALAVSLAAITVGAILSTALLVGPAAIALRLTNTPGRATVVAALIAVLATWLGIVLAYDSFNWPPSHDGWPVSFFIVTLIFLAFVGAQFAGRSRRSPLTASAG